MVTKVELEKKVKRLEDNIEHLMRCKEFESNLQRDVINVGLRYIENYIDGKTYSVTDAWWAIQKKLKELDEKNGS